MPLLLFVWVLVLAIFFNSFFHWRFRPIATAEAPNGFDAWMEKNARANPPVSMEESNQVLPVGRVYFFWGGRGGGGGWEYIHVGGMNIDGFFACRRQHFILFYFIYCTVL